MSVDLESGEGDGIGVAAGVDDDPRADGSEPRLEAELDFPGIVITPYGGGHGVQQQLRVGAEHGLAAQRGKDRHVEARRRRMAVHAARREIGQFLARLGGGLLHQFPPDAGNDLAPPGKKARRRTDARLGHRAAQHAVLLNQQGRGPGPRGLNRRHHAGRPASDYDHIIALLHDSLLGLASIFSTSRSTGGAR